MEFASWVPDEVREGHQFQEDGEHHTKAPVLHAMDKILSSVNDEMKNTWFSIDKKLAEIRRNREDLSRNRNYRNTYNFILSALHASISSADPFTDIMFSERGDIVRALYSAAEYDIPNWIKNYTTKQRASKKGDIHKKKKSLEELIGFLKNNDLDISPFTIDKPHELLNKLHAEVATLKNEYSILVKAISELDAKYDDNINIHEIRSLISRSKSDDSFIQTKRLMNQIRDHKISDFLYRLSEILDFCMDYSINFNGQPSLGNSDRDYCCYSLVLFFKNHLGSKPYLHAANITQVLFDSDISVDSAEEIFNRIERGFKFSQMSTLKK